MRLVVSKINEQLVGPILISVNFCIGCRLGTPSWQTQNWKTGGSEWDLENFRCSAGGNGFHVGVVALSWEGLYAKGLLDHPISPGMVASKFLQKHKADFLKVFKEKSLYYQSCPDVGNILGALQGRPFKGRVNGIVNATQVGTSTVQNLPPTRNPFLVRGESWDEEVTVNTMTSETDEVAASSLGLTLMT